MCHKNKKIRLPKWSHMRHWCPYHIFTPFEICYWTNASQKLNLFVFYDKKQNVVNGATSSMCLSSNISLVRNLSKCIRNSAYNIIPTYRIHSKSPHHKQIFFIWLQSYTFCSISGWRHIHYLQNRINLYGKQVFLYLW